MFQRSMALVKWSEKLLGAPAEKEEAFLLPVAQYLVHTLHASLVPLNLSATRTLQKATCSHPQSVLCP